MYKYKFELCGQILNLRTVNMKFFALASNFFRYSCISILSLMLLNLYHTRTFWCNVLHPCFVLVRSRSLIFAQKSVVRTKICRSFS